MRRLTIVLLIALAAACDPIAGLDGARRISGEPFRADFMATADCMGVSEDSARSLFADTRWYHAPNLPGDTLGHWRSRTRIYLKNGTGARQVVIRHEVIHLVIQNGGHDHTAFGDSGTGDACETPEGTYTL